MSDARMERRKEDRGFAARAYNPCDAPVYTGDPRQPYVACNLDRDHSGWCSLEAVRTRGTDAS